MLATLLAAVLGARKPSAEDLHTQDPRWLAHESQRYSDVRSAAWGAAFGIVLFVAAGIWYARGKGTRESDFAVAAAAILLGATVGRFLSQRAGHRDEVHRAIALGAIFYQRPEVLRGLLRSEAIDGFLQSLLRTVLRNDELGTSLWREAVSPLVDMLANDRYRISERYDVVLRRLGKTASVPLGNKDSLVFPEETFWRFESDLAYERSFADPPAYLRVGLVFDIKRAPDWFEDPSLVLREYSPLDASYVNRLCASLSTRGVLPRSPNARRASRLGDRAASILTRPRRELREQMAVALCRPRLEVDGIALPLDDVAVDSRGIAAKFVLDRKLRRHLQKREWASVRAGVSFPLPKSICAFPVHFPQPTRGAEVTFDYSHADVVDVVTDMFFMVNRPFEHERVRDREGYRVVATDRDEWVLPGAGLAFNWRLGEIADRPPVPTERPSTAGPPDPSLDPGARSAAGSGGRSISPASPASTASESARRRSGH